MSLPWTKYFFWLTPSYGVGIALGGVTTCRKQWEPGTSFPSCRKVVPHVSGLAWLCPEAYAVWFLSIFKAIKGACEESVVVLYHARKLD